METKKIDVLFGFVAIGFLVITIIWMKDFNNKKTNDFKEYAATITSIVKQKNNKIKILANRLLAEQKENEDLKSTLADARNDLVALSKKLAQQAPVTVPASAPAVVTAPSPEAATK